MGVSVPDPAIAQGGGSPPPKSGISEIEKIRAKMGVTPPSDSVAAPAPSIRLVPIRPVRVPGTSFALGDTLEGLVFRLNLSPDASATPGPNERVFAGDIRYFSQDAHGTFHFTERWLSRVEIQTGSLTEAMRRFIVDEFLRQGYRRNCGQFDRNKVDCDWIGRTMVMMQMDSGGVNVDITLPEGPATMQAAALVVEPASAAAAEPETLTTSQAEAMTKMAPVYPDAAREANVDGTVHVLALVDPAGLVRDVRVMRSDSSMLDDAALTAVRQWVFKPRIRDGQPVSFWVEVPVKFSLH